MKNNANNSRYHSSFSLTPRFDSKYVGAAIPFTYSKIYGTRIGASIRLFPIVIGTSNLMPFFSAQKDVELNGADIYVALKVPIHRKAPKDRDGDLISDKIDLCNETPGIWKFKGCPDTDKDGIQDSEDKCPTEAGLTELNGCPDTDSDGISDHLDNCPKNAGPEENKGCPWPDSDSDGILDKDDKCPNRAGPIANYGCPYNDSDEDGILDKDDKCPNNAGPIENYGCPYSDTDGDGILDKDDDCVNVSGIPENNGCPEIKEEEQEVLNTAFENLEFETAKAIIKEVSFESLDNLAELLIKKPEWRLRVAGHTDNQGSPQKNLILSNKRAEAIKIYLNQRGVDESRIVTEYYGEEKPIADNNTPEGRQKNRRVEMTVLFE